MVNPPIPAAFDRKLSAGVKIKDGVMIEDVRPETNPGDPAVQMMLRSRQLRLAAAQVAMERAWNALGGPKSVVGLPKNNRIALNESGPSTE